MAFDPKSIVYAIPVAGILSYFNITSEVISIYAGIVVVDTVLSMVQKYQQNIPITSRIWIDGVTKKITRLMLPFLFAGVCRGAGFDMSYIAGAVTALMSLLIAGEGYSALRHIYNINTGKDLPEIEVFDIVISRIAGVFKGSIQDNVEKK